MKTNPTLFIALIAAIAGTVFATLGHLSFPAALRGDTLFAVLFSVIFVLKVARDFSRRSTVRPLTTDKPAPLLRPTAPIFIDARDPANRSLKSTAINHDFAA